MKKLLVLPGNSPRNRQWGEECAAFFADRFDEVFLQVYDHWESGKQVIDVPAELDKIAETVASGDATDEWYICAKSVGSLVALFAFEEGIIVPQRSIFFGMPLDMAAEELLRDDWSVLEQYTVLTLVFHNDHDPVASCTFSADVIAKYGKAMTFVMLVGDTHDYLDFPAYDAVVTDFLQL